MPDILSDQEWRTQERVERFRDAALAAFRGYLEAPPDSELRAQLMDRAMRMAKWADEEASK